jgi:uncharacterized delta-60 repeat protein
MLSAASALAQDGTLHFATSVHDELYYPVMDCHGPLSGAGWTAQIWMGPPGCSEDQLVPLLPTTVFSTNNPGYVVPIYLEGSQAGFFDFSQPTLQIRVWKNENGQFTAFSNATMRGVSPLVQSHPLGGDEDQTVPAEITPFGGVELIAIKSPDCPPVTNGCCFEIAFCNTNFSVAKQARSVFLPIRRNVLSSNAPPAEARYTAQYILEDITASAGQDYVPQSGSVIFPSSSASGITVQIIDSPVWRSTRTLRARVFDPAEGVVLNQAASAMITITDEDTVLAPFRRMDGSITAVLAAGGRWIVAGDFTDVDGYTRQGLARLDPDGALDPGFDPAGAAPGLITALALQADGALLVGGSFTNFAGLTRHGIARLREDGGCDAGFNPAIDSATTVQQLAVQGDGRLLVAGTGLNAGALTNIGLLRLNSNGSLDAGFVPPATLTNVNLVQLQADGKILASGPGVIARLTEAGSLDPGFTAQLPATQALAIHTVLAMLPLADGRILVGGSSGFTENDVGLAVLTTSGAVAPDQVHWLGAVSSGWVFGFARQPGGRILVTGTWGFPNASGSTSYGDGTFRFTSDLTQDPSYDAFPGGLHSMTSQPDGTTAGVGSAGIPHQASTGVTRIAILTPGGTALNRLYFSGIARLPDGQLHLALRGYSPYTGMIQVSGDLVHWTTLTNSAAQVQGMVYKETFQTNAAQLFYRVITP